MQTSVLIVGGGPVGCTLGLDLASRGINVIIAERNPPGQPLGVKCNHVAARTMEIFRRLGIAAKIRDTGLPADHPNDVSFRTSATGVEFARITIPCRRDRYSNTSGPDGWWPTPEPPHRINQIYLDPLLADLARAHPKIRLLNNTEIDGYTQTAGGVAAFHRGGSIACDYLVGCDGPASRIRQLMDVRLIGDAMVGRTQSTYIRAPDLRKRMIAPPAWSTQVMNARRSANMFAVDGRETWLIHNYLRAEETDFAAIDTNSCIRTFLGTDAPYDIIATENWIGRRMLAERFRDERVFICGDAAHLWVPFGGYGMNAGIADAANLAWMLAGVLAGWADSRLLDAHEAERWPITDQVSRYAMSTAQALARARRDVPEDLETNPVKRAALGRQMLELHTPQFCCGGLNFGSYYDRSPIIVHDGEAPPPYTMDRFTPSTVPGCRTPHIWLADGQSLYDAMGPDFCLLRFDPSIDVGPLSKAAAFRGLPLHVLDIEMAVPYAEKLVLSRPDQHVAWRGNVPPLEPLALVDKIRGAA